MNLSTLSDMPAPIRRVLKRFGFTADSVETVDNSVCVPYVAIIRGRPYRISFFKEYTIGYCGCITNFDDNTQLFTPEGLIEEVKRFVRNDFVAES